MAGLREPPPPHHSNAQSAELQGARPGRGVARGRRGTWCGDDVPAVSSGLKVSTGFDLSTDGRNESALTSNELEGLGLAVVGVRHGGGVELEVVRVVVG